MLSSRSLTSAVLALGLGTVLLGGCDRQSQPSAQPQAGETSYPAQSGGVLDETHKGAALPALTVKDPDGQELALAGLKGRPVIVNLWATWCAPCVAELPTLEKLAAGGKVRVVTIDQDMSPSPAEAAKVASFLADRGLTHLHPWLDPENSLAGAWHLGTLPATIGFDAEGREVWRVSGERDWTSADSAKLLARLGRID